MSMTGAATIADVLGTIVVAVLLWRLGSILQRYLAQLVKAHEQLVMTQDSLQRAVRSRRATSSSGRAKTPEPSADEPTKLYEGKRSSGARKRLLPPLLKGPEFAGGVEPTWLGGRRAADD